MLSTRTNFFVPDDSYTQIKPLIDIKENISIELLKSGIVEIDNTMKSNSEKKSFFNIQIFYSEKRQRYFIRADYRKTISESDIIDIARKSQNKLTEKEVVEIFDLNLNDFIIESSGKVIGKNGKKIFHAQRVYHQQWDTFNYAIIQ